MPAGCWGELLVSAILVPLASHDLDSEYCSRVAMYDAAPGGHGRAWTTVPLSSVTEMAQAADGKMPMTGLAGAPGLSLPYGVPVDEHNRCPLQRVELPQ
eukprot:6947991-Heterocapsa_arctica.AAC.1